MAQGEGAGEPARSSAVPSRSSPPPPSAGSGRGEPAAPLPTWSEADRLAALERYAILDTGRETAFDDVAALAADILDAPIAVVNLIAADRQWFKAEVGIGADTLPLDVSICRHAMLQPGVFIVPDLAKDARFDENPLVQTADGLRFYAGALLETPDGFPLGTVCVLDTKPRPAGLSERQARALKVLASQTMARLELRRSEAVARAERARAEKHARRLALLSRASSMLLSNAELAGAVRGLFGLLAEEFRLDVGFHYRCGEGALHLVAAAGLTPDQERAAARIEFGETVCGIVAATREPTHVVGIQASDDLHVRFLKMLGLETYFSAPLLSGDDLLGTVSFGRREGPFSTGELEALRTLVAQLSTALERQHAEAGLRESEAGLRFALKAGKFGTWSLDLATEDLETSDICRSNFGRLLDQPFTYADLRRAVHPGDRARMASAVERSIATGEDYDIEYRTLTAAGEARWVHVRGQPGYDAEGAPLRMSGVSIDITERRRGEAELQETVERLQLATENAEIGFWDVDPVNDVLIWPARTKAMFGISPDAPVSMQDFYDGLHPDDRETTSLAYAAAADPQRRALYDVEYRTIGKDDGLVRWVAAKGRGVFDETGRCTRLIGTAIDISARKRAEEALRDLNETLEARVEARTAELASAHEQLRQSQKLEAIGQLTGGVAHDFNNLLTVIRGSVELLRRPDLTDERRARYLDAVGDTAGRAAGLTQQLLAFARRQTLKPEPFDVSASLSDVKPILVALVGARIELDIAAPDQDVFALADRGQFDTAIVNMAVNARDAMGNAGRLTIAASEVPGIPAHRSHPARAGDFIAVTVTDTGSGIAPDQLDRIFEPFYTTKPAGEGTGLGLSQVFGFANQSGGDLRVDSPPGGGATFTLYLPRVDAGRNEVSETEKADPPEAGDGVCVLVVEDNRSVGAFAADALRTLGYDSVLAQDADAALEALEADCRRFHVVFSDVMMPGMDGLELRARIAERFPQVPVILTSGYSHVLAQTGQRDVELLQKPYTIEQLSAAIRKAIVRQADRRPPTRHPLPEGPLPAD